MGRFIFFVMFFAVSCFCQKEHYKWSKIGENFDKVYADKRGTYATYKNGGAIFRFDGKPMQWTKIGSAGAMIAINELTLYKISLDKQKVLEYDNKNKKWKQIGGPAVKIYAGGKGVFIVKPEEDGLYSYKRKTKEWVKIGPTAKMFDTGKKSYPYMEVSGLFMLKSKKVWSYTGTTNKWKNIGGRAEKIVVAGNGIYAIGKDKTKKYLEIYKHRRKKSWRRIATEKKFGRILKLVGDLNALYVHTKKMIYRFKYNPKKIRGANMLKLFGGWNTLEMEGNGEGEDIFAGGNKLYQRGLAEDGTDSIFIYDTPPLPLARPVAFGKWKPSWTSITAITNAYVLLYNSKNGRVCIRTNDSKKNGTKVIFRGRLPKGYTNLITFRVMMVRPHVLCYNKKNGKVALLSFSPKKKFTLVWKGHWTKGITSIKSSFDMNRKTNFLLYNSETGDVSIQKLKDDLRGTDVIREDKWDSGWSSFEVIGRVVDNKYTKYLFSYNKETGQAKFSLYDEVKKNDKTVWEGNLRKGGTLCMKYLIMPEKEIVIIMYVKETNNIVVYKIEKDYNKIKEIFNDAWGPDAISMFSFYCHVDEVVAIYYPKGVVQMNVVKRKRTIVSRK